MDPNLEQSEDSDINDEKIPEKIQSVKKRKRYMDPNIEESEDDEDDDETAVQQNDYIQRDHFKIKGELRTISKKFNGFNLLIYLRLLFWFSRQIYGNFYSRGSEDD